MPHFISIQNLQDAGLDIYARLSEVQLLRYREPKPGIFIAESPIVVERALAAGYRPISVLMDEAGVPKQQGLLKMCIRDRCSCFHVMCMASVQIL